MSNIQAL